VAQSIAADPVIEYMSKEQLGKTIQKVKKDMEKAAKELDFIEAARLRDEMFLLEKKLK
jgi:excinuclease ABC subunit B